MKKADSYRGIGFFCVRYQAIAQSHLCIMNIENWYKEGEDFWEGVALLRQAGRDTRLFEPYMNENFVPQYYKDALITAVQGLKSGDFKIKTMENSLISEFRELPKVENETITALRQAAKLLHKRHADCHAQLHILASPELRLPIITEIMEDIIPELDEIYDTIRKNGAMRDDGATELGVDYLQGVQDGYLKTQKLNYLKNRIFKLESKNGLIAKETDKEKRLRFEDELIQKQKELAALSVELGIQDE